MKRRLRRTIRRNVLSFVLLYCAVFTLYFTSETLSRYAGKTYGNTNVGVAKWGVDTVFENKNINIVNGGADETYTITVSSNSETGSTYSIIVSGLPANVQVKLDDRSYITSTGNDIEFPNAGSFDAGDDDQNIHTLYFRSTTAAVANNVSVQIEVVFVQDEIQ